MAKKTLKKRITDLANALGTTAKPSPSEIRNELFAIAPLVEALEDGQTLMEKDARIADLESQLGNLQITLDDATAEIERFHVEQKQKQREEREAELPEVQFQILKRLPSEHGGVTWTISEISYIAEIPVDEAEIHIDRLEHAGLIKRTWGHSSHVWHRTIKGSEIVLAERLATENQSGRKKAYKHNELGEDAQELLMLIARNKEGIRDFEAMQRCGGDQIANLRTLHNAGFVINESDWQRRNQTLKLAQNGAEYLGERDLI